MTLSYTSPLNWPGARALNFSPRQSRFSGHNLSDCLSEIISELSRFGAESAELSADWSLGVSGKPLVDLRRGGPVVLRYYRDGQDFEIPICEYDSLLDNLWALAKVIEALRTMERHGGDAVTRMAESGFAALPAPDREWWDVLGVKPDDDPIIVHAHYKVMAKATHPDVGGSEEAMAELNSAYDKFKESLQ